MSDVVNNASQETWDQAYEIFPQNSLARCSLAEMSLAEMSLVETSLAKMSLIQLISYD